MSEANEFSLQLSKEWQLAVDDITEAVAGIGLLVLRGVVLKSPVDTGRFKGNWIVSSGSPSDETTEKTDKAGGVTIEQGAAVLNGYPDTLPPIYVQNNLPYANRLENGHSKQAPNGMAALTVAEITAQLDHG